MSERDEPWNDPDGPTLEPDAVLDPVPGVSQTSRTLTLILDDLLRVPGTEIGIGLDGLVGLIPGIGDASTTVVATAILADAVRNRVPIPVLARMGFNLGVDALLGLVPGVGDLLDIAHRANRKNLRLLEAAVNDRQRTKQRSTVYLICAIGLVASTLIVLLAALIWGIWLLWRLITG
ncbi:DUF4112 domain-containing protein [Propionimicrobium sp. PCR01-08-3]|uniref:DUF4112 domain-containing protein n=1 Tax=Propionimicrobium sp. PCR01-08-3 TaxID=3052086 RepID=UPI00255CBBBA|nr:DUF4112 domain-containing protein [Propionimicrobium sp. PCR01-08-3]WIY83173.1 DUF4112 domain-containing protein [Propionimicrobium sp. PCR01-08-3]